jgi:hypothetical protein
MTRSSYGEELNPKLVARYLKTRGWRSESLRGSLQRLWLPEENVDAPVEIFLNLIESQDRRNTTFSINAISEYYEISIEHLIRQIKSIGYDVFTGKIPDEYVVSGTIPLGTAAEYMANIRDVLIAAASTEISEARSYQRARKEALVYSDGCRFGHTFRGSFGFQV